MTDRHSFLLGCPNTHAHGRARSNDGRKEKKRKQNSIQKHEIFFYHIHSFGLIIVGVRFKQEYVCIVIVDESHPLGRLPTKTVNKQQRYKTFVSRMLHTSINYSTNIYSGGACALKIEIRFFPFLPLPFLPSSPCHQTYSPQQTHGHISLYAFTYTV